VISIGINSIFVENQDKAEKFYVEILGFSKKADVPIGKHRWLTVGVSGDKFELSLEPNIHPAAKTYQKAIFSDGIPATMFFIENLQYEYNRLCSQGVEFQSSPQNIGEAKGCSFNDSCGNWIMLYQK